MRRMIFLPAFVFLVLAAAFMGCDKDDGNGDITCRADDCNAQCVSSGYASGSCVAGDCVCQGGGDCNPATEICQATGRLTFEARFPEIDGSQQVVLGAPEILPGIGMMAAVVDIEGTVTGSTLIDSEDGSFTVPLTTGLVGGESLVFATLLAPSATSDTAYFAVLVPPSGGEPASFTADPWAWVVSLDAGPDVGDITITEDQGSGAMFIYLINITAMLTILDDILEGDPTYLATLAVVWGPGVTWSCGCCYAQAPQQISGGPHLDNSIFIGGEAGESGAWGYVILLHEFGHFVAQNYSRDDSPGGSHYIGQPIAPPFAWSEGWATFFALSTFSRWAEEPDPLYWDIQGGSSFWIDYGTADVSAGSAITPPDPEGAMDQDLDENWVGIMLWDMWDGLDVAECCEEDGTNLGTMEVFRAVVSDRFISYDRGATGADFVDFVDAVLCNNPGLTESVTATLSGYEMFPYDGLPGCP